MTLNTEGDPNQNAGDGDKETIIKDDKDQKKEPDTDNIEHEPDVGSPRWKKVYWEKKNAERELKEFQTVQIHAMATNKNEINELKNQIEVLTQRSQGEEKIPDVLEDPEGNQAYWKKKVGNIENKVTNSSKDLKVTVQEAVMQATKSDYDIVIQKANLLMKTNINFKNKITISNNPYKTAYEEIKKLEKPTEKSNNDNDNHDQLDNPSNTGSYHAPTNRGKRVLSKEEEKIADDFNIKRPDYLKHIIKLESKIK